MLLTKSEVMVIYVYDVLLFLTAADNFQLSGRIADMYTPQANLTKCMDKRWGYGEVASN